MPQSVRSTARAWLCVLAAATMLVTLTACTPRWARQATADGAGKAEAVHPCPVCGEPLAATDRTAVRWARSERLFRCAAGHETWLAEPSAPRVREVVVSDPCPSCGQQLTWSGQTRGEGKAAVKVYICPSGHTVDRTQR